MNRVTLVVLLLCSSGRTGADLNQKSSEALMQKGPRPRVCGVPDIKPNVPSCLSDGLGIVNGEEAVPHSWPWQVFLQGYRSCGGSLINKDWVVTAAHCRVSIYSTRAHLGWHSLLNRSNQIMTIGKVFSHPEYNDKTKDYDIALLKLQLPAQLNDHVSPVCVAETGDDFAAGMKCVATGWGRTRYYPGSTPIGLQQVCLPLISDSECKSYNLTITSKMLCAGVAGGVTCNGDSGGPLVCEKNGAWTLVGVTSWGKQGCPTNLPGVYSSITALRAWMNQIMNNN